MLTINIKGKALGVASRIIPSSDNIDINDGIKTVKCVTIDSVIPKDRKISIIQLDVEGFEKQALSGALNTIKRCLPIIILENLPEKKWLEKNILELGYRVAQKVHHNTILIVDKP